MEKITEKILLEKSSPRTNKLEQIKTLNLSRMGLKSEDLPVPLLSKLCSLEQLDLSGNLLQEIPRGLSLPSLKILNCSNNDMEDVVSVEALRSIEELRLEDNLYLTVNDEHKVIFLLPMLRMFNGKDISSTAHHIRHGSTEILRKRVAGMWERSFSVPDPITAQSLAAVEKRFVNAACTQIKYGPNSLSEYTKWRVEMIAREYLKTLTCTEEESRVTDTTPTKKNEAPAENSITSPQKRTRNNSEVAAEVSPRKSSRLDSAAPVEASPRKSTQVMTTPQKTDPMMASPRKHTRLSSADTPEGSLRKSSRLENISQKGANKADSPRKAAKSIISSPISRPAKCESPRKTAEDQITAQQSKQKTVKTETDTPLKTACAKLSVPQEPVSLQPFHVLQCHSRKDSPDDFSTQLWACAFEPPPECGDVSGGSRTVATCGGETLCVIDCESGNVLKKYKVPGEEFFSLAWSSVLMSRTGGSARPCNILAAGGKRGRVKLIHPRVNLAFGEFSASRRAISIMRFSPRNTSFLFTGTYENKIFLWDIGRLDCDYNFNVSKLLILETGSTPLHLSLLPTSPDTHLLSGCDDGLYVFDIQLSKNTQKRNEEMEIVFPVYKKKGKENTYRTIDGLSFLSDDIVASKSHMQGSIYLWSWSATRASWNSRKKEVPAVVLAKLQWSSTDIPYLSLATCPGYGYVVCGDERGRLWMYHITDSMMEIFKSGKTISATEVLEWPSPVRTGMGALEGPSINSIAMDPDLRYLVALTDKNMAVVWKRESQ
ncbi:leucine-rich repeat and WD repeat-containing protein 1 [Puntigrus tetrazona]|uniref:leucine-rich repeat and WD repeat-containing protein 1 n=1 Tax=Puntigrus tetrazona TaxID=1606681 RepID=UPI001C894FB7|nr:leucine-rich repeat and WD repeat-containing protein 1 [Puntigrus tetrazona]XP_043096475.1 leucine-rich repeat and WD repeat-containing protein 1 [Puntigrus tetrazona]